MAEEKPFIQISASDLSNPKVDEIVAQQQAGRQAVAGQQLVAATPFYLNPVFYLGGAGATGALLGWALLEPHINEGPDATFANHAALWLLLPVIGGMIGLFIGAVEGIISRNLTKGMLGGSVGMAMGLAGGVLSNVAAGMVMGLIIVAYVLATGTTREDILTHGIHGWFFICIVMARSLGWTIAGMTVALGQGIAMKSGKMTMTGFLGGMLGGAIGGLVFDPVTRVVGGAGMDRGVGVSRAVGCACVGLMAGIFVGLVEHFAKEAWLLMAAGPLAGKQFVVYKNPTTLGSSPKCDIYLFKDPAIEPRHAQIHKTGVHYEIEDLGSASGTYVNQMPIKRQRLQDGDRIALGTTVLQYLERARDRTAGH